MLIKHKGSSPLIGILYKFLAIKKSDWVVKGGGL
jgi:hypothetical protein